MKGMRYRLPQFSYYDRTGIERYLEKQAQKGLRLCKIKGMLWCFEEAEPTKLHYAVSYLPAASAFDPEPTEAQCRLEAFCRHTGWQQAAYNGEMQIFCHADENPVPIETDALLEVENIHRAMKKSFLPSMVMLFLVGVMQMAMFIADWLKSPIAVLTQNSILYRGIMALILLIMTGAELVGYFWWRHRAKAAAERDGSFVETRGHHRMQWMGMCLAVILLCLMLTTLEEGAAGLMVFAILYLLSIFLLVQGVTLFLKKKKVDGETNKVLTITAAVVLSVVMIGILPFLHLGEIFPEKRPEQQTAPLLPTDYLDTEPTAYEITLDKAHSPLLQRSTYYVYPQEIGRENPGTAYVIYDAQWEWAYELCLQELLAELESYRLIDAADFDAPAAYRQYWGETAVANGSYIVCYDNRIVLLHPGTELTGTQMQRIAEKIKP